MVGRRRPKRNGPCKRIPRSQDLVMMAGQKVRIRLWVELDRVDFVVATKFSGSRGAQCLLHRLRRAIDDQQIGARRPFRLALALLPMAQRIDAESETAGKLLLGP